MFNLAEAQVERARKIHKSSLVVDTHNDTILHLIRSPPFITSETNPLAPRRTLGERSEHGQIDIPRIQIGGVDCLLFAMYVSPQYSSRLLRLVQMLDAFQLEIDKNPDTIAVATSYNEIAKTVKDGKIAAVIAVEGGEPLEGKIESLRTIYRLGARSLTLTHFPRNELGDGSEADSGSHLTGFGRQVVEEMNSLGMLVDISHLNETGFWDVIEPRESAATVQVGADAHVTCADELYRVIQMVKPVVYGDLFQGLRVAEADAVFDEAGAEAQV